MLRMNHRLISNDTGFTYLTCKTHLINESNYRYKFFQNRYLIEGKSMGPMVAMRWGVIALNSPPVSVPDGESSLGESVHRVAKTNTLHVSSPAACPIVLHIAQSQAETC